MHLKNMGKIEGGSRMFELSTLGGEDDGATNRGSKHKQMDRF